MQGLNIEVILPETRPSTRFRISLNMLRLRCGDCYAFTFRSPANEYHTNVTVSNYVKLVTLVKMLTVLFCFLELYLPYTQHGDDSSPIVRDSVQTRA